MSSDPIVFWIFLACIPPANLFPLIYLFRPWRTTPQGRALMLKAWGNLILIDLIVATLVFGEDYPFRDVLRVIGFGTFAGGLWYLFLTLMRAPGAGTYPPRSWFRRRQRVER